MTEEVKQNDDNQDVFEQTKQSESTNVFDEISSEVGKNYNDKDAVIKALKEKDSFIEQLKNENQNFGDKLDKVLSKLDESKNAESVLQELTSRKSEQNPGDNTSRTVGKEDIKSLFQEFYSSTQQEQTAQQNLQQVNTTIKQAYGDNAAQALKQKAESLGMSVNKIKEIASESPSAAFSLLGITNQRKVDSPAQPTRGASDIPASDKKSAYQEFKEMMKQNNIKPGSPRYYREMMKADFEI